MKQLVKLVLEVWHGTASVRGILDSTGFVSYFFLTLRALSHVAKRELHFVSAFSTVSAIADQTRWQCGCGCVDVIFTGGSTPGLYLEPALVGPHQAD